MDALKKSIKSLEQIQVVFLELFVKLLQVFALLNLVLQLLRGLEVPKVGLDELPVLGNVRPSRRLPVDARHDVLEPEQLRDGGVALGHQTEQCLAAGVVVRQEVHSGAVCRQRETPPRSGTVYRVCHMMFLLIRSLALHCAHFTSHVASVLCADETMSVFHFSLPFPQFNGGNFLLSVF